MVNLFKSVMVFTDIHLGLKHNSVTHLNDCIDYINWLIVEAKSRGARSCICMGDFFHHRNTINSQTLEYGIKVFKLLNDNFDKTFIIVGNHDLYWRESRDVTSVKFASLFPNIQLIDNVHVEGDVALVPWLVDNEWKKISSLKTKYIFGHLELPGFKMNAQIVMPDHIGLKVSHFVNQDMVFSGHFHNRQNNGKVFYIGNTFGHNYSDVWDINRGAMYLSWGGSPEFINYTNGPFYININLSTLVLDPGKYLKPKTYVQAIVDMELNYEEATTLRETFLDTYKVREFKLLYASLESTEEFVTCDNIKTVDEVVIDQLHNIESKTMNVTKLIEIYNNL